MAIPKVLKKWDEKLDSHAPEKGAKKLVSSNCTKILEKEWQLRLEKHVRNQCLLPLIQKMLQILSLLLSDGMLSNCQHEFSDIRTSDCQQIFSDTRLPN